MLWARWRQAHVSTDSNYSGGSTRSFHAPAMRYALRRHGWAGVRQPGALGVEGAAHVGGVAIERALDEMFATGSFERVVEDRLYPALVALGDAWARGEVDVAGEHVASAAALRRLGMAFEAAGNASGNGGRCWSAYRQALATSCRRSRSRPRCVAPASMPRTSAPICPSSRG